MEQGEKIRKERAGDKATGKMLSVEHVFGRKKRNKNRHVLEGSAYTILLTYT